MLEYVELCENIRLCHLCVGGAAKMFEMITMMAAFRVQTTGLDGFNKV